MKGSSILLVVASLAVVCAMDGAYFGGVFTVGDPYCVYCPDANPLSVGGVGCQCPAGYTAFPEAPLTVRPGWGLKAASSAPLLRVSSTCGVGGDKWRSSLSFCMASSFGYNHGNNTRFAAPTTHEQFAGFYQKVNGACAVPNPITHSCSCPSDSDAIVIPHRSAGSKQPVVFAPEHKLAAGANGEESDLVMCGRRARVQSNEAVNFGGAFSTVAADNTCINRNPFTGACSCPAGSQSYPLGLVGVDGKGMTVHVCGPAVVRGPNIGICDGEDADNSGTVDAGPAINRCFARRSEVQLPYGTYLINTQLRGVGVRIEARDHHGDTCLRDSSPCPILRAGSGLTALGGMFVGRADFYNVVFDGNRLARTGLISQCAATPAIGYNILELSAAAQGGFQIQGCAIINAVCGAGLYSQIVGGLFSGAEIQSTWFRGNGGHEELTKSWANGLHIGSYSNGFQAQDSYYTDNTDSHVAIDEPTSGIEIEDSTYVQQSVRIFAGIRNSYPVNGTLDLGGRLVVSAEELALVPPANWGNQYQQNTITGNSMSYFGIQIGGRPWRADSPPVSQQQGLEVEENDVTGHVVGINADAGSFTMQQNNYGGIAGKFLHCSQPSSLINISPDSRVDRQDEPVSATHYTYAGCVP